MVAITQVTSERASPHQTHWSITHASFPHHFHAQFCLWYTNDPPRFQYSLAQFFIIRLHFVFVTLDQNSLVVCGAPVNQIPTCASTLVYVFVHLTTPHLIIFHGHLISSPLVSSILIIFCASLLAKKTCAVYICVRALFVFCDSSATVILWCFLFYLMSSLHLISSILISSYSMDQEFVVGDQFLLLFIM